MSDLGENSVKEKKRGTYKYPIAMTAQFRFCGNPFRVDLYKGCSFGCLYCFAQNTGKGLRERFEEADFGIVEQYFYKAFETDIDYKDVTIELLRHKVPLHVGGMSDPFQDREWNMHLTYKLIELSNKYEYPIMFSSKTAHLADEYYDILRPDLHAFQTSIIGYDDDYIKRFEVNTPTSQERIDFVKQLHEKGFWTCVRIQPLIDIDQALKVCEKVDGIADYLVVEHLKVPVSNRYLRKFFHKELLTGNYVKSPYNLKQFELKLDLKKKNIEAVKNALHKTVVGVGDNELHYLSQSRNCCGIDTIPSDKFSNWLKYNLTYFTTAKPDDTENYDELYIPQNNISSCVNNTSRLKTPDGKTVNDAKTYTDYYCYHHLDFMCKECPRYDYYKKANMAHLDGGRDVGRIRLW